ncbi:MAG TPA: cytochrome P450 [Rhizomicrobium sp.]|nr:cytochrome P450 [Rhizomicrobium sp.]
MNLQRPIGEPRLAGPEAPEKPLPFFKSIKLAQQNVMATIPRVAYSEPIWQSGAAFGNAVLVSDPAGVKHVLLDNVANYPKADMERLILGAAFGEGLLTLEGEKWRGHRRIMSPSFDFRSLVSYTPAMLSHVDAYAEKWKERGNGAAIDVAEEMTKLTLRIVARTMFSANADDLEDLVGGTLARGQDMLTFSLLDVLPLIGPWHMQRTVKRVQRAFSALDTAMYPLIDARTKVEGAPRDLLDRLIAARDSETGAAMDRREVRDEVVIIFLAGHETTAVALTFIWYLLSQHPEAEAKLHAELAEVLGGRTPVYEDIAKLPYTRMVIEEAMRLYPPAPALATRQANEADTICGTPVKKRQMVVVLPWVLHRHEKLWDDPQRFDPERFSPERGAGRPRFAYLPFGGGPRICIGAQLALIETTLILATLAQHFRLRLAPGAQIDLQSRVTLRPVGGMPMILERR